jgi:hypothetical protein
MKTTGSQNPASGARTACTLKVPQARLIYQTHPTASLSVPANTSLPGVQRARRLGGRTIGMQTGSGLLLRSLQTQTQRPWRL